MNNFVILFLLKIKEVEMGDRGTSPPTYLRSTAMSRKLVDHRDVGENLKAYEGVLSFKENISISIMQHRGQYLLTKVCCGDQNIQFKYCWW